MALIGWINQNPGVSAVLAILLGFAGLAVLLVSQSKRQTRKTAGMLKRLDERVMSGNGRLRASMMMMNQSMSGAAANLNAASDSMEARQERLRLEMDKKMDAMRESSERKLDEMREGLSQRMQKTLEARLGESFRLVSGQLESVYKGLGEMRALAEGVGDLKRVLSNVKTRGVWGEVRLRALLEESLTKAQYDENVCVRPGSQERVEFAIRLPGREADAPVWLPIDSKLPLDDYMRLITASESGNAPEAQKCAQQLESAILEQAKRISSKYICPPHSTDFAILFLPLESLYGEALSRRGLMEKLQSQFHVLPAGPSAFAALLNCLQMGFRTLAVEKRSGEILRMLGGVRAEFTQFGETLDKARARLTQAAGDLDSVGVRTRALNRRLTELESERDAPEP